MCTNQDLKWVKYAASFTLSVELPVIVKQKE